MALDALERSGLAPAHTEALHIFCYFANVLSQVWNLPAFNERVLKTEAPPFYPEIQAELDQLVIAGLVIIGDANFQICDDDGYRLNGKYGLNFQSSHLQPLLCMLGCNDQGDAFDPQDAEIYQYLVELAGAFSGLWASAKDLGVAFDATYSNPLSPQANIIHLALDQHGENSGNRSVAVTERFAHLLPAETVLSGAERLYLYARFLKGHLDG